MVQHIGAKPHVSSLQSFAVLSLGAHRRQLWGTTAANFREQLRPTLLERQCGRRDFADVRLLGFHSGSECSVDLCAASCHPERAGSTPRGCRPFHLGFETGTGPCHAAACLFWKLVSTAGHRQIQIHRQCTTIQVEGVHRTHIHRPQSKDIRTTLRPRYTLY